MHSNMNYQQTLDFLFTQLPMYQRVGKAAYKADLETTLLLDEHFRHPHQFYPTIHVAGTNGKGSVSHILAAALQEAGYRTGLYTSPHLKDFRERIRINGEMISEDYVVQFVSNNQKIIEDLKPSFFEITAAMAFDYFARERVDVAVIETGMGGRLDSTNIIKPLVSVITNIGLDHTRFLGNSIEKIAEEKAGIIKPEIPVVIGEKQPETSEVYARKSAELAAPVNHATDRFEIHEVKTQPPYKTQFITLFDRFLGDEFTWELDLVGKYQAKNLITALTTLDAIRGRFPVDDNVRKRAFKKIRKLTGFKGRWEVLAQHPLTIADTAHNPEGLKDVVEQLSSIDYKNMHIVLGVVDDKNIDSILKLLPLKAYYYYTKASIPRALDEKILKQKAVKYNLHGESFEHVGSAINAAQNAASESDLIFVGGSTFIVAEVL